ncbi:GNAT family N-acetyltransferase [Bacillus sp. 1NLA3E]|uniref:GNAT family N-acetyltransferase n=1 Tax=Bacillus sp. 1NLA3E TaxID=666686 RepID=UPI000247EC05|nr:GNAT family N-acetyltransferase [Bacillus sp. 1NLA3E]AGK54425.1 GCN5-like N-acetyltransferase [Bacillus sp. 1NLA3E]
MNSTEVYLKTVKEDNEHLRNLISKLDEHLSSLYPSEGIFGIDFNDSKINDITFAVAYIGDSPVGCGAIRPLDSENIEIKRFYVDTNYRKKGIATKLLKFLEKKAEILNFKTLLLETGNEQPEAISLYQKNGYNEIEPYGEYIGCDNSICFAKRIF